MQLLLSAVLKQDRHIRSHPYWRKDRGTTLRFAVVEKKKKRHNVLYISFVTDYVPSLLAETSSNCSS